MEALLQSLAMKYGMDKAIQLLGIDEQTQNPKYAINMGGNTLDIGNMAKRGLLNRGINAITGGSSGILSTVGPLALGAGAIYFLNKNREKLTGYKTQQAYEDARDQRRADNRLDYITDRMTSGKNYGNYEDALLDSGAGAVKIDDVIMSGSDYFPEPGYKKFESIEDIVVSKPAPVYQRDVHRDEGSTPSPSKSSPSKSSPSKSSPSYSSSRGSNFGSRFHFARGGIASL
jgi:hypothetical protein